LGLVVFSGKSSNAQQPSIQSAEASRRVVSRVAPLYPDLAKRMQISGTVKVEATVAPNGRVRSTKVIGGSPVLTKAVLDALQSWKWESTASESKELVELTFRPE
jgi:protein TonB